MIAIIAAAISLVAGCIAGYIFSKSVIQKQGKAARDAASQELDKAVKEAESKAKEIIVEAKDEAHKKLMEVDKEVKERRFELSRVEKRITKKEEQIDTKTDRLDKKENELGNKEQKLQKLEADMEATLAAQRQELERISAMSTDDAKSYLLKKMEKEVKHDAAMMIRDVESKAREEADKRAREAISLAIQRCAVDQVVETTVSVVQLPNDEMKGRIIGREGRNIRAFETLTGVDLIVDDTPEAVVLSGFDPIRREIARRALEKLIADGRIHPSRIEELIDKTRKELEAHMVEEGEKASFEVGISNVHPELIKLLGRLKFRTSYGQNVLQHSLEVAFLAGSMASELDADVVLARRAGLLHDIGKAVDFEVDGPHAVIGADLARKYREGRGIIHAIAAHHGEEEPQTVEAILVQAADAISATRPGARRETLESYIRRITKLEELASSFEGVEKTFAIQAGREVRIMVKPEIIDDDGAVLLAREIAKKIEQEMEYPGQIKVNVIRESRAIDYAK